MEKTFVIIKPDAVERGIIGDIITRFEKIGLKMVGCKLIRADKELAGKHYPNDRKEFIEGMGQKTLDNYSALGKNAKSELGTDDAHEIGLMIREWLVDFLISGPVLAMVLEGPHAVELVRKITGHTLPAMAQPGTIRGDYSFDSSSLANSSKRPIRNLIHASGDKKEAEFEINLWFSKDELLEYDSVHQKHMTQ